MTHNSNLPVQFLSSSVALPVTAPQTTSITPSVVLGIDELQKVSALSSGFNNSFSDSAFNGEKYLGGLDEAWLYMPIDYYTMRLRSARIFQENMFGRGLIRRMITNEINTGITPESIPEWDILASEIAEIANWTEEERYNWSEDVESRWLLWSQDPFACDYRHEDVFSVIQQYVRREAIIEGDILVINRQNRRTGLPKIQLVQGSLVVNPMDVTSLAAGHKIDHGVELDSNGRQVAYWVQQDDFGVTKRIPAFGARGRRTAKLIYGVDKRLNSTRGEPLLGIILQSLKEIDRYRDSAQRKAVVNSILAMYIMKNEPKAGTTPVGRSAVSNTTVTTTNTDGSTKQNKAIGQIPGVFYDELQHGEEPKAFKSDGTDINYGAFEEAMIQGMAWCMEMPPEILRLSFSSNYSASQAATNEYKLYLERVWADFGSSFLRPIYNEWLISSVLMQYINAPGFLEAFRNPEQFAIFQSWLLAVWIGSIKPSIDSVKQAKGLKLLIDEGLMTRARACRQATGQKFSRVIVQQKHENELVADARKPLQALIPQSTEDTVEEIIEDAEDDGNTPKAHAFTVVNGISK